MSENIRMRCTMMTVIAAGLAAAVAMLLKVIVTELPRTADMIVPIPKIMATG